MEAKHKAYLEELAAKVDAKLLEYVQVTPETRRQAQVVEAHAVFSGSWRQADPSGAGAGILPDFWRLGGAGNGGGVCH